MLALTLKATMITKGRIALIILISVLGVSEIFAHPLVFEDRSPQKRYHIPYSRDYKLRSIIRYARL